MHGCPILISICVFASQVDPKMSACAKYKAYRRKPRVLSSLSVDQSKSLPCFCSMRSPLINETPIFPGIDTYHIPQLCEGCLLKAPEKR